MPWQRVGRGFAIQSAAWQISATPEFPEQGLTVAFTDAEPPQVIHELLEVQPTLGLPARSPSEVGPSSITDPRDPLGLELVESVVRGNDLICHYGEGHSCPFQTQLDWRYIPPLVDAGRFDQLTLELWLSLQTTRLECYPALRLLFPAAQLRTPVVRESAAGPSNLWELELSIGGPSLWGYVLTDPEDPQAVQLVSPSSIPAAASNGKPPGFQLHVLGSFLEKGVIRRTRLRLILSGEPLSPAERIDAAEQFASAPLPLTA
jgi:hypothetical protein